MNKFDKVINEYNKLSTPKKDKLSDILFHQRGIFGYVIETIELLSKPEIKSGTEIISLANIPGFEKQLSKNLPYFTLNRHTSITINVHLKKILGIKSGDGIRFIARNKELFVHKSNEPDSFILSKKSIVGDVEYLEFTNINLKTYLQDYFSLIKNKIYRIYTSENFEKIQDIDCLKIVEIIKVGGTGK